MCLGALLVILIAGLVGGTLVPTFAADTAESRPHAAHGPANPDAFAKAMHAGMVKMMADMENAGMTGDPDRDFLAMMIPHHEGAVEMARLLLIHGKDPLVRRLAEEIIASQQAEIEAMRARHAILNRGPDANPDGFPAIHGTRGPGSTERPRP